jgi:hypothetical protein
MTGTLCRLNILSTILVYAYRAKHFGDETPWWYALLQPFGIRVFIYAMLVEGEIEWRGTRYPLKVLKDNVI